jgi:hypothetical protein
MNDVRRFPSEMRVAAYYLETAEARRRSLTDYERRAGCPRSEGDHEERALRGIVPYDAEPTRRAIERALVGIHDEWVGALLVCLGWGALIEVADGHERSIRTGPWMERARLAGLPRRWCRLPDVGLTRHGLWARRQQFREALAREGVMDAAEVEAWAAVERGEYEEDGTMTERLLAGWKEIADWLRVSETTAQKYEHLSPPLPVIRVGGEGGMVRAFPAALAQWMQDQAQQQRETRQEP